MWNLGGDRIGRIICIVFAIFCKSEIISKRDVKEPQNLNSQVQRALSSSRSSSFLKTYHPTLGNKEFTLERKIIYKKQYIE